jgi:hypothetical protein
LKKSQLLIDKMNLEVILLLITLEIFQFQNTTIWEQLMTRYARALAAVILAAFCAGCGTVPFDPQPRPASVAHLDIVRKQEYIHGTKATLKTFLVSARDLRSRDRDGSLRELADRFGHFVTLQVVPIVNDFDAENSLSTRLEIAKLQLLCGFIYCELGETRLAGELLEIMKQHYGSNPGILGVPLDRADIGVPSMESGLELLEERLAGTRSPAAAANRPLGHSSAPKG